MTAFYLSVGFEFYFFAGCQRLYRLLRMELFLCIMLYHQFRKLLSHVQLLMIKVRKQPKIYCIIKFYKFFLKTKHDTTYSPLDILYNFA